MHIASIGLAGGLAPGEMLNIDYAIVDACAKTVAENADIVLGVKVRITDSEATRRLVPWLTVKGGRPWGRPPLPVPFTY